MLWPPVSVTTFTEASQRAGNFGLLDIGVRVECCAAHGGACYSLCTPPRLPGSAGNGGVYSSRRRAMTSVEA